MKNNLVLSLTAYNMSELAKINKVKELETIYDSRKSFYKKAFVLYSNYNTKILKSYDSYVCVIDIDNTIYINKNINSDMLYSQTTLRHIKEFIKQTTGESLTKKDILKLNDIKILEV